MSNLEAISIVVSVVSGVSGLVLGILNQIHQRDISRPRLVVRPRVLNLYDMNTGETVAENAGVMEVHNVGHVPVKGSIIGFYLRRGLKAFMLRQEKDKRCFVKNPEPINDVKWTGELKPQQVAMLRFNLGSLPGVKQLGPAFAKTIVDDIFTANKRDMRKFAEQRKALSSPPSSD
jgi:hypothetical protein